MDERCRATTMLESAIWIFDYCLENAERFGETLGACYAGYPMRSEMAALMATSALSVVSGTMEMAAVNDWSEADARRA